MARDGSGTYTRVSNSFTEPVAGTTISPTDAEAFWDELDDEITDSLSRSGKGGMSADLDMNNNDINEIKTAVFQGSTSGNTTVIASAEAGTTTLTLPAATDTLVGKATTDTLTNKTFNTGGTGNVFQIAGTGITAVTGTGSVVLATSPTLVTPALGTPSSGNGSNLTALNATQLTTGTIPAARTNGHQNGTATNDDAAAGEIGEYIVSIVASGSAVSLTSNTPANLTSISLTAGDWDVQTNFLYTTAATTNVTFLLGSISTTSATLNTTADHVNSIAYGSSGIVPGASAFVGSTPVITRVSLSGTTTIYSVAQATFTVSTLSVWGTLRARRVR